MWDRGHPQGVVKSNTTDKIKSEKNKEGPLTLESKSLQDVMQLAVNGEKLKDPYVREVAIPLRVRMFTKKQL